MGNSSGWQILMLLSSLIQCPVPAFHTANFVVQRKMLRLFAINSTFLELIWLRVRLTAIA